MVQHNVLKINISKIKIEILVPDFRLCTTQALKILSNTKINVFNHNIETVRSLSPRVRHKASYDRTLGVLKYVKSQNKAQFVKSGIMVGLGETENEVKETIRDLYEAGCDIITIGHYLQASRLKIPVKRFITPEEFKEYEEYGLSIGVKHMYCGPFVRSSYNADLSLKATAHKGS